MVSAPSLPETTLAPISLISLLSRRNQLAVNQGIIGQQAAYDNGKYMGSFDRSDYDAFKSVIADALGSEAFCDERKIPYSTDSAVLIDQAQMQLNLSDETKARILESLKPEEIIPHLMYADAAEAAVWARVRDLSQEVFDAHCTGTVRALVLREDANRAKRPERSAKERSYEPAADNAKTQSAIAFRETLSALLLREWHTAIAVTEPFALDRLAAISDFTEKFQRSGYVMSDGGLSQQMADRIAEIEAKMPGQVALVRTKLLAAVERENTNFPFELEKRGTPEFLELLTPSKKVVFAAEQGSVTMNYLPAVMTAVLIAE